MIDDRRDIDAKYCNVKPHGRLAFVFLRDTRGANSLTLLARYESRVERSFYRAHRELQRLRAARPLSPAKPARPNKPNPRTRSLPAAPR